MPDGLTADQIPDLVMSTLPTFHDRRNIEAAFVLQKYYFIDEVFTKDRIKKQSGRSIEWRIVLEGNGTARHSGLYATRDRKKKDVIRTGYQRWVYADAEAYYESHELTMNSGEAEIANYIQTQYFAAYKDLADELEKKAPLAPNSSDDDENPHGFGWWICMLNSGVTDYVGQFGGITSRYQDATTSTVQGGIDASIETMWRNWAANHNGMNLQTTDTIRRGMVFADFRPPRVVEDIYTGPAAKNRLFSSLAYQVDYERLVNMGPDDRNGDLSPFKGVLNFRGVMWIGLPSMENLSYNPIYCINFSHFIPVVHSKWWMYEDTPLRDVDQRHVYVQGMDCQYNYFCNNKRQVGFVVHEPIP